MMVAEIIMTVRRDGSYRAEGSPAPGNRLETTVKGQPIVADHMWQIAEAVVPLLDEAEGEIEIAVTAVAD